MSKRVKKKNNKVLIIVSVLVIAVIACICIICALKNKTQVNPNDYSLIRFSEMYETINGNKQVSETYKSFDGKKVELSGYMAVQSPLDESFMYLVNQPYVSCPFCAIGDITKLEIIPIYDANGKTIKYTENGVVVRGTLEVAEKVDSLNYTTQFRIYADQVTEVADENVDTDLQAYYANLSDSGMILDIQQLQMNIEYDTKEEYLLDYGTTKREMLEGVREYWTETIPIEDYIKYIKECPDIVEACMPQREDLVEINNELIDIYNKEISVLEKFYTIIKEISVAELTETDEQIEGLYNRLIALNADNLKLYNDFNNWNNKLRE